MADREISFEIVQHIGKLSEGKLRSKELNIVKWGNNEPKFDIRSWDSSHEMAGKGITLNAEEIQKLKELLDMFE